MKAVDFLTIVGSIRFVYEWMIRLYKLVAQFSQPQTRIS